MVLSLGIRVDLGVHCWGGECCFGIGSKGTDECDILVQGGLACWFGRGHPSEVGQGWLVVVVKV
jgi:hypothetical protein